MTDAPFMMDTTACYKTLEKFKKTGIHYAFVSDEYGVFQGVITLNDILGSISRNASRF
jgi:putative hemolysin